MTNEEAIIYLKQADVTVGRDIKTKTAEALEMAIKTLEQETVSKESYDHEYFLRKEFEIKIARLEHDKNVVLDKVRAEIVEMWQNEPCVIEGGCLDEILEIIDKYKAETEDTDGTNK